MRQLIHCRLLRVALSLLLVQTVAGSAVAQTPPSSVTVVRKAPTDWMKAQIKSVSQFADRYEAAQHPAPDSANGQPSPVQALFALVNEDDARLRSPRKGIPSAYYQRVQEFTTDVAAAGKPLPRPLRLLACAEVLVWQGKHRDTLRVYLQKRYTSDNAAYWQVIGADPMKLHTPPPRPTR